ncbi:hypothetical protein BaRGS_00022100 [Batillaria attramentaria]|uniref:Uncharacterized protein n=1 Tax=Batillaria attramentaria TaxID=370345 RepID=A0ABD0KI32_9CAEN
MSVWQINCQKRPTRSGAPSLAGHGLGSESREFAHAKSRPKARTVYRDIQPGKKTHLKQTVIRCWQKETDHSMHHMPQHHMPLT